LRPARRAVRHPALATRGRPRPACSGRAGAVRSTGTSW
jgi:hypothetical protein